VIGRSASLLIAFGVLAAIGLTVATWRSNRRRSRSGPAIRLSRWH